MSRDLNSGGTNRQFSGQLTGWDRQVSDGLFDLFLQLLRDCPPLLSLGGVVRDKQMGQSFRLKVLRSWAVQQGEIETIKIQGPPLGVS